MKGKEALAQLSAVANAPIFSLDGPYFGEGVHHGGPIQSVLELSKKAAEVALRILDGEKAGDIKPSFVKPASPIFDWRQLQRWGIAESNLPPGKRNFISAANAVAALLVANHADHRRYSRTSWAHLTALLRQHRQRHFAEVQSRQRMSELARVIRFFRRLAN